MTKSEYIVWRVETIEEIKESHPEWKARQVQDYFERVQKILERKGLITIERR